MKNNSIVKSAKFNVIVLFILGMFTSVANAQVQRTDTTRTTRDSTFRNSEIDTLNNINRQQNKSDSLPLPKGTDQMQGENNIEVDSPGTATYNIVEENGQSISEVADWRTESNVEELKVYSGNSEGNTVIRTIEVTIPKRE
ncbi:MAG: hypothetical protein KBH11_06290 [Bacteroidia bacterium]|nr:hypothetical protein [Bacteroidota bacterium]MBP9082665.1 hypothetical protein [Bacteroidia bacterium]